MATRPLQGQPAGPLLLFTVESALRTCAGCRSSTATLADLGRGASPAGSELAGGFCGGDPQAED